MVCNKAHFGNHVRRQDHRELQFATDKGGRGKNRNSTSREVDTNTPTEIIKN